MVAYAKFYIMDSQSPDDELDLSFFENQFDKSVTDSLDKLEMVVDFVEDSLLWISEIVAKFTSKTNSIVDPAEIGSTRLKNFEPEDISGRLMLEGTMFRAKFAEVISVGSAFFVLEPVYQTNMVAYGINALMGALVAFRDNWEAQSEENKDEEIIAVADHFIQTSSYEKNPESLSIFKCVQDMIASGIVEAEQEESGMILELVERMDVGEKFLLLMEILSIVSEVNMTNCHNFTENDFDEFNDIFFNVLISKLKEFELFSRNSQ